MDGRHCLFSDLLDLIKTRIVDLTPKEVDYLRKRFSNPEGNVTYSEFE